MKDTTKSKYLNSIIDNGITLLKNNDNIDDEKYNIWIEYSTDLFKCITIDNPQIFCDYLSVKYHAMIEDNLTNHQRLSMCLKYLIGIKNIFI